ncbi:DUF2252 domain-containing protein [Solibacillus sp. MA9]|uniref:DUF2252 domain-containing protein n=1 Tax=Solibacillus palustris TaxID=2908203 RepID=A0ABS9UEM1_9BACL|nr:DUF2252 family protein [Solibacillus sp. MA9]MCH7322575.1 DUF2252 domain-containing protein [Solibacillus sp. MA9]
MTQQLFDSVQNTRILLRKEQIQTIFEQFDHHKLHLTPEQRIEKYKKMADSPFRYFRGSAYLFYYDTTNSPSPFHTPEDRPTWIMGDMHMDNFGAFQNENGDIVFDVNDFDEGYVGSFLYDVLRMSISIGLYLEEQQLDESTQQQAIERFLQAYIKQLKRFQSKKDDALSFVFTQQKTKGPIKRVLKKLEKRQREALIDDITEINANGERVFIWNDEIQPIDNALFAKIVALVPNYHVKDIAIKYGSGTASIGLERYYLLVNSHQDALGGKDLVLEMKEVRSAIPAYFLPYNKPFWNHYVHQGARVVGTQKAMHHLQDPHLAYVTMNDKEYYIRERSPYKRKVKPKNYRTLEDYYTTTEIMGKIAAKIHARADLDYSPVFTYHSEDEILKQLRGNEEIFIEAIILQAMRYKQIVNADYALFTDYLQHFEAQHMNSQLEKSI